MKALKIILLMFLLITLFVSFGCQSMQTERMGESNQADHLEWRPTGTGFYTPEYQP